ncbi:MAG TPA: hypothetical protein VJ739_00655, partial [Gemmataceae bacterium]|nr:hypothetical protein [Gemmataceae bacterium]
ELAARKELHDGVTAEASRVLAGESWRGQEQAALLLTQLDFEPAARRLVELLGAERGEVYVTAAWGLRKLDVPETLPAVAQYAEAARAQFFGPGAASVPPEGGRTGQMIDHQLSQLNQFLGRRRYKPAGPLLLRFLPRPGGMPVAPECRAAAAWALGWLHEGRPTPEVVKALEGRLNDTGPLIPEAGPVRCMAAVALARLGAREALPSLRKYYRGTGPTGDRLSNACGWAIERLTGEKMPAAKPYRTAERDEFLNPG